MKLLKNNLLRKYLKGLTLTLTLTPNNRWTRFLEMVSSFLLLIVLKIYFETIFYILCSFNFTDAVDSIKTERHTVNSLT